MQSRKKINRSHSRLFSLRFENNRLRLVNFLATLWFTTNVKRPQCVKRDDLLHDFIVTPRGITKFIYTLKKENEIDLIKSLFRCWQTQKYVGWLDKLTELPRCIDQKFVQSIKTLILIECFCYTDWIFVQSTKSFVYPCSNKDLELQSIIIFSRCTDSSGST